MGIDDIILSFVISYLAGSITPLNDLFTGKEGASLHDKLKQCYRNALKRWSANDNVRNRIAYAVLGIGLCPAFSKAVYKRT